VAPAVCGAAALAGLSSGFSLGLIRVRSGRSQWAVPRPAEHKLADQNGSKPPISKLESVGGNSSVGSNPTATVVHLRKRRSARHGPGRRSTFGLSLGLICSPVRLSRPATGDHRPRRPRLTPGGLGTRLPEPADLQSRSAFVLALT